MSYDEFESQAEAMSCAQIEHDMAAYKPTSSEIYAMCCESDTADQHAMWLCAMAGVEFPPKNESIGTPSAC